MEDARRPELEELARSIERPDRMLLVQYAVTSLAALFLAPFVFVPLFFKYHTLRYRLDDEGVSASWGILFKREIHLTYRRIQDIHVKRNLLERWLGIGTVEVQTASGSSSAELTLEGMRRHEELRDHLYACMRGHEGASASPQAADPATGAADPAVELLESIRDELRAARRALEARG